MIKWVVNYEHMNQRGWDMFDTPFPQYTSYEDLKVASDEEWEQIQNLSGWDDPELEVEEEVEE